jgi:hypothetical protein
MPIRRVSGGFQYGSKGKVYKQRSKALKQMRAIKASQAKRHK